MAERCRSRSARCASVKNSWSANLGERCKGVSVSSVQIPCKSGSPHGVVSAVADRVAAAAAFHPLHRDGRPGAERRSFAAEEVDVADAIELVVVGHSGLAIAEADLRPQIEVDLSAAIGRLAPIGPSLSPLVDWERPS